MTTPGFADEKTHALIARARETESFRFIAHSTADLGRAQISFRESIDDGDQPRRDPGRELHLRQSGPMDAATV